MPVLFLEWAFLYLLKKYFLVIIKIIAFLICHLLGSGTFSYDS